MYVKYLNSHIRHNLQGRIIIRPYSIPNHFFHNHAKINILCRRSTLRLYEPHKRMKKNGCTQCIPTYYHMFSNIS